MSMEVSTLATILITCLLLSSSHAYTAPTGKGLEVRVCQDRDCLTDGAKETLALVESLASSSDIAVSTCGCLGPCGAGPNVDIRQDGIRVKDKRVGMDNYFIFRKINSAEAVADMLRIAGVTVSDGAVAISSVLAEPTSTREWYDLDRTSRIALQRLLYIVTALPLLDAEQQGTWDKIGGVVIPNSYYAIAGTVFILSQFMGTSSKANAVVDDDE